MKCYALAILQKSKLWLLLSSENKKRTQHGEIHYKENYILTFPPNQEKLKKKIKKKSVFRKYLWYSVNEEELLRAS